MSRRFRSVARAQGASDRIYTAADVNAEAVRRVRIVLKPLHDILIDDDAAEKKIAFALKAIQLLEFANDLREADEPPLLRLENGGFSAEVDS